MSTQIPLTLNEDKACTHPDHMVKVIGTQRHAGGRMLTKQCTQCWQVWREFEAE